jgi:DivIVA domain-containing protein
VAISFSRPDPSSPAAVADASFPTSRRGFDQNEVRDFLRMVAAELARLQERERYLDYDMGALRQQRANLPTELDDEAIAKLLGEETARIVHVARESSNAIRIKAEEAAQRAIQEATEAAQQLRDAAEAEAAQRLSDAHADAEAEIAMAKQQGREMVEEARAYRERALGELAKRRDLARQQIDQLLHGRDRLVQAFERARLVAVDVVAELTPLGELDEYVNLSPTTGPVPMMVPKSRLGDASSIGDDALALRVAAAAASDAEGAEVVDGPDEAVAAAPDSPDAASHESAPSADHPSVDPPPAAPLPSAKVLAFPGAGRRAKSTPTEDDADDADDGADESAPTDEHDDGNDLTDAERPDAAAPAEGGVDDLFARLRAGREVVEGMDVDAPSVDEATDAVVPSPFERRDEALTPLIVASARKLKRVLADEQNVVLDRLRRPEPVRSVDDLLSDADRQSATYFGAISAEVLAAAEVGAESMGGAMLDVSSSPGGGHGVLAPVEESLRDDLVGPLRSRLATRVAAADGDNEEITKSVRAVYREWKTRHIDNHLDDLVRLAHGRGVYAALTPGEPCRWVVDPSGPACSDCADNALQGAVAAGSAFPTGHVAAPAHAGCRCLLARDEG